MRRAGPCKVKTKRISRGGVRVVGCPVCSATFAVRWCSAACRAVVRQRSRCMHLGLGDLIGVGPGAMAPVDKAGDLKAVRIAPHRPASGSANERHNSAARTGRGQARCCACSQAGGGGGSVIDDARLGATLAVPRPYQRLTQRHQVPGRTSIKQNTTVRIPLRSRSWLSRHRSSV